MTDPMKLVQDIPCFTDLLSGRAKDARRDSCALRIIVELFYYVLT